METKRESLKTLLGYQLALVATFHVGTVDSCKSGELLNAILGVEALVNAIAALPLTPEEQGQVIGSPSGQFIEQCNEQDAIQDKIILNYCPMSLSRFVDEVRSDDDAGW